MEEDLETPENNGPSKWKIFDQKVGAFFAKFDSKVVNAHRKIVLKALAACKQAKTEKLGLKAIFVYLVFQPFYAFEYSDHKTDKIILRILFSLILSGIVVAYFSSFMAQTFAFYADLNKQWMSKFH